ncbi:PREDICTED: post-GPI attachment to proteins factor 3 [Papilio polytes]|uniref:post-GPI attachment to proteins factor 3 n=1 Tax=Papilio polytes TaxID=76194 RepID=UPI000676509F|nr:PREDICTED: post-GPI attachment to proteins factor 3 [Papilio polytes]
MQLLSYKFLIVLILFNGVSLLSASNGDRSPFYQKCLKNCVRSNCTEDGKDFNPTEAERPVTTNLLSTWNCLDECQYDCMWRAVDAFKNLGYDIPKFYGKWPFKRILGVQEPGSVFASFLNLAAHVYMYKEFMQQFPVTEHDKIGLFWHFFALVCVNGWSWSIFFHMKDSPFSEFMDYAGALSMVMIMFIAAVIRVFENHRKLKNAIVSVSAAMHVLHVYYLYCAVIDYDYNMMVNLVFGVAGGALWAGEGAARCARGRGRGGGRLLAFVLLSAAALSLELLDFPPYYDTWDAHALWHLATVPLPLLFWRYVIDDLQYTRREQAAKAHLKMA